MSGLDSTPLFNELADRYDEVLPFFATFGEALMELVRPRPGTNVLDVATGRGAVALAAARRGCRVTATDAAPRMAELLRHAAPRLDVRVMDAHDLDFPDHGFDLVTMAFAIHCVDEPEQVAAEAARVTRRGGRVVMTVPGAFDDEGAWDAFGAIGDAYEPVPGALEVARPTDVAAVLAAAGLVDLREEALEVILPLASPEQAWAFHLSHGFLGYLRSFSAADQRDFERRAMAELRRMAAAGRLVLHRGAAVHSGRVP